LITTSILAALAVATLGLTRFLDRYHWGDLLEGAAFLPLAMTGMLNLMVPITGFANEAHVGLDAPGQLPLYAWTATRAVATATLVVGAWLSGRHATVRRIQAVAWFVLPTIAVLATLSIIVAARDGLPALIDESGLDQLRREPVVPAALPGRTALYVLAQLGLAAGLLVASLLYLRRTPVSAGPGRRYLAVGLVIAAFAQVHSAAYPGSYAGLVTSADLLRLAVAGVLLAGLQRDTAADLARLRVTNLELAHLASSEGARAAAEERGRVAREFHDGLVQELWRARLKLGLLLETPGLGPNGAVLADEAATAVDRAVDDAREAVMALRSPEPARDLRNQLDSRVTGFQRQSGIRAELVAQPDLPWLAPGSQLEVLRILDEALTNVSKHADATMVRVNATADDTWLRLSITDNGRGFSLAQKRRIGLGLRIMEERAELIHAELAIATTRRGTSVTVSVRTLGRSP